MNFATASLACASERGQSRLEKPRSETQAKAYATKRFYGSSHHKRRYFHKENEVSPLDTVV